MDGFPSDLPASIVSQITPQIRPGERILGGARMNVERPLPTVGPWKEDIGTPQLAQVKVGVDRLHAVTDRRLYTFGYEYRSLGQNKIGAGLSPGSLLAETTSIPLADITNVGSTRTSATRSEFWSKFVRGEPARLDIEVWTKDGRHEHLWTTTQLDHAQLFLDALRDAHDRVVLSGGSNGPSIADELARLGELKGQGLLSNDDWDQAKELFLGKKPDERQATIENLRQLHGLHKAGVLSESEFNMKKWDILSRS